MRTGITIAWTLGACLGGGARAAGCAAGDDDGDGDTARAEGRDEAAEEAGEAVPDSPCRAGLTLCEGYCVDTTTDPLNCGLCNHACLAPDVCNEGSCTGSCEGRERCGSACVDLQGDPENCGRCGRVCVDALNADAACEAGECALRCHAGWSDEDGLPGCEAVCVPRPAGELCNGEDDDCDAEIDEGFPCVFGDPIACTTLCGSAGTGTCSASCAPPAPSLCIPPAETCNNADDDCDGQTDDGFPCIPATVEACTTTCGSSGVRLCLETCEWNVCVWPPERCNGVDDDCDGETDEGC